jgi:5-bromo-4-chloroindolyl phosphate hydrolysis protein
MTVNQAINEARSGIINGFSGGAYKQGDSQVQKEAAGRRQDRVPRQVLPQVSPQVLPQVPPQPERAKAPAPKQYGGNVIRYHYDKAKQEVMNPVSREKALSVPKNLSAPVPTSKIPLIQKPKGRASGVLAIVFGALGTLGSGIPWLVFSILVQQGSDYWLGVKITTPLMLLFLTMFIFGVFRTRRLSRYYSYIRILRGRNWCEIQELGKRTRIEERVVRKDIDSMIKQYILPNGRIDRNGRVLMLDESTYQQYLDSQEALRVRQIKQEEEKRLLEENPDLAKVSEVIEDGKVYIEKIRKANEEIPGIEISNKLYELESIINRIFQYVERYPEKLEGMKRFVNYYLPTTIKLVDAYRDLDKQDVAGINIKKSKQEIEDTIDTINGAFAKLFDSLFAEQAMDISTDISVLQTMFAQEGLTKSDFADQ